MSIKSKATQLKSAAEINAETCIISSYWRAIIALLGMAFALAAALSAYADSKTPDKIFTVCVLVVLVFEAVIFGYHHWTEDAKKSREFENLAGLADRLIEGDPDVTREEVEEEAEKLGTPNQFPEFVRWAKARVVKRYAKVSKELEPIYDSANGANKEFFEFIEAKRWRKGSGLYGEVGTGQVNYPQNTINIERTNVVGRVRLKLIRYRYNGEWVEALPGDPLFVRRTLQVKFQAKAPDGPHKISLQVKLPEGEPHKGSSKAYKTADVENPNWIDFTLTADNLPNANDLYVYFDDQIEGTAPTSIQIRNLVIRQI